MPRRTLYYRPQKKPPVLQERFVQPIKALIEREPSYGYRTMTHLLGFSKNTVPIGKAYHRAWTFLEGNG